MAHGIQLSHSVDRATADCKQRKAAQELGTSCASWLSRALAVGGACVGVRDASGDLSVMV